MLDPAITRHRETTRCDAGQVTGSDSRHLAGLTEAQRDQAMARWQVLRPHIEDGLSQKSAVFSDSGIPGDRNRLPGTTGEYRTAMKKVEVAVEWARDAAEHTAAADYPGAGRPGRARCSGRGRAQFPGQTLKTIYVAPGHLR